ncbi:MAG: long-chain fatty acid--CoA ligase [Candidatus Omnitrophota bacterium]|jgi:long-chain acyl-CoA synthetase
MAQKRSGFPPDCVEENGNLVQVFQDRARFFGSKKALFYKIRGEYTGSYSWRDWMKIVRETAMALHSLGIRKGDHVGILSENGPEWTFADLGILSLGAVTVPIYPTASLEDICYIINHADLKALFVSTEEQYHKIEGFKSKFLPAGIILFTPGDLCDVPALGVFREIGRRHDLNHGDLYDQCVRNVGPDDLATIIYTSGTTGAPKGVMLTHRNFIANYQGSFQRIQIDDRDSVLSFLPLSHVFERLAGYYYQAAYGVSIAYAENFMTVAEDIRKVRPTIVVAVPRFYEKTYVRILEEVQREPVWKQRLFNWAVRIGTRTAQVKIRGHRVPIWLGFYNWIAKKIVFNKIKQAMGGRIRFFISGGAPLSKDLARFFYAAEIMILEGYGLTETSPVIAVNALDDFRFGTVGKPIPGISVRIAEDGEILTQGPCVMRGYYHNPHATAECIKDGWFHTGDMGHFDGEGFLHITDRKKDIIVTAGGKNVSPQNIESRILADPFFLQAIVLGDKRPYLCALLVPHKQEVLHYAEQHRIGDLSYEKLLEHSGVQAWVRERLEKHMEDLAGFETVRAFILLPHEFTLSAGEMTPTLKIRRRVVMKEYQKAIDELYRKTDDEWRKRQSQSVRSS